jgi:hypothetical protein
MHRPLLEHLWVAGLQFGARCGKEGRPIAHGVGERERGRQREAPPRVQQLVRITPSASDVEELVAFAATDQDDETRLRTEGVNATLHDCLNHIGGRYGFEQRRREGLEQKRKIA